MKRSQINTIMQNADAFIRSRGFYLPPFAYWTPEEWAARGPEVEEIVDNRLGWDITDFGQGDFTVSFSPAFTNAGKALISETDEVVSGQKDVAAAVDNISAAIDKALKDSGS